MQEKNNGSRYLISSFAGFRIQWCIMLPYPVENVLALDKYKISLTL